MIFFRIKIKLLHWNFDCRVNYFAYIGYSHLKNILFLMYSWAIGIMNYLILIENLID